MISARGTLVSDRAGIRLQFSYDLAKFWNYLILKETGMILHTALRCSKIGLHRPNSYHGATPNKNRLKRLVGSKFNIKFDVSDIKVVFSHKKGYWVSFIQVNDPVLWGLLDDSDLKSNFDDPKSLDKRNWNRYNMPHMSIANGKYMADLKNQKDTQWFWDNQFTTYR